MRILIIYLWLHVHKGCPLVCYQPVFKKVVLVDLNSLRQSERRGAKILLDVL